jgi:hypothetical protein
LRVVGIVVSNDREAVLIALNTHYSAGTRAAFAAVDRDAWAVETAETQ